MHKVCRLNCKNFNTVFDSTVECLVHIVNLLAIPGLHMVDDDLGSECTSYIPVWECFLECILYTFYIHGTAIVEGCTEAYNQQLLLADIISIARIIFAGIAGIAAEVVRICLFSLDKFLLSVSKLVPCRLGSSALLVGLWSPFLDIDCVNQRSNLVCNLFVCLFCSEGKTWKHTYSKNDA